MGFEFSNAKIDELFGKNLTEMSQEEIQTL